MRIPLIVTCMLAVASALAEAPHVHGVAELDAALEAGGLRLEFHAPLEDLVGFEREPATTRERASYAAMEAYFKSGRAFVPTPAAGCRLGETALAMSAHGGEHAELEATFTYQCASKEKLQDLEAAVFRQYPRIKRIEARIATPTGQSARKVTPGEPRLTLR